MGRSRITQGMPDVFQRLARDARKAGFTIEICGSGHLRWTSPTGESEMTGSTFYDGRLTKKYRARLRRIGVPGA